MPRNRLLNTTALSPIGAIEVRSHKEPSPDPKPLLDMSGIKIQFGDREEKKSLVRRDPFAGVSFGHKNRSLVLNPSMKRLPGGGLALTGDEIDPLQLRFMLLFWDFFDIPTHNLAHMLPDAETAFLMKAGLAKQTVVEFQGQYFDIELGDAIGQLQGMVLQHHEARGRGGWSVLSESGSSALGSASLEDNKGLLISLHKCIPVPDKDVPIEDLLEFKTKKNSELLALRFHLEELYQVILNAPDQHQAILTQFGKLETAIEEHLAVCKEARFKLRLGGINGALNIVPATLGAMTAGLGGLIAGLIPGLSIGIDSAIKGRKRTESPFNYISSFHRELFWSP